MKKALLFILLLVNVYYANANYKIGHYRWRNDDGSETTATWKGAIDDPLQISIHDYGRIYNAYGYTYKRIGLRIFVQSNQNVTITPTLEYSKDNGTTWNTITTDFNTVNDFYLSTYLNSNSIAVCDPLPCTVYSPTTQQISTETSFVTGRIVVDDYPSTKQTQTTPLTLTKGQSTEIEYYIVPTSYIESSQTYVFRMKNSSLLLSSLNPTLITGNCYTTIPSAPTANTEQTFCLGTNPTIANLVVADTNIVWYDAAASGNELPTNTPLVDGNVYYCQKFSYCTVGVPRTAVTARIPDNSITTNTSICEGTYTWLVNGITYTTSGNYTFVKDCHTEKLNLTVNPIPVPNAIDNQIFENNQVTNPIGANKICGTVDEGQAMQLTAPVGFVFTAVPFASFGTPNGTCDNFTLGSCHATNSIAVVEGIVLGKNSATIPATNDVFGDPCGGTPKRLYVEAAYGTVRWTNDTPSIGLPASGTGTLPSFTAVNSSCSPVVATITVIFNNGFCDSAPKTFTITVNPNTIQTTTTTVCDSYTWPANGIVYTTSGMYSIGTNCNTQTLNLTIDKTAPPIGSSNQLYTTEITLADLKVTGSNFRWYDSAVAGNELSNSTTVKDNTTYYATQTVSGCESTVRSAFTTHKISEPSQTVCLNATVNDLVTNPSAGKTTKWYTTALNGNALPSTTPLSNGTYYVEQHEPTTPVVSTFETYIDVNGIRTRKYFSGAFSIALDTIGNLFVPEMYQYQIQKITSDGSVNPFAGGTFGFADGMGTMAQFRYPTGITIDKADNLYVTDRFNHKIRKITSTGEVSTFAGSTQGDADGISTEAQFNNPKSIAIDAIGNLYVADGLNYKIKKITPAGVVSTLAGTGTLGYVDGPGTIAQFDSPFGIAVDAAGFVYVTESLNGKIRKITPDGVVSTLAGSTLGDANGLGTAAQFSQIYGIALDASGNVYVSDLDNFKIRKITPAGMVSTFIDTNLLHTDDPPTGYGSDPNGLAIDNADNLYVGMSSIIKKITQNTQSNRVAVTIVVNPTPPIASTQSFCGAATVSSLVATGTALQWYTASTAGVALISTDVLATGTYYVSQTASGCESARMPVSVTITPSSDNVTIISACDSYTWNGTTYTTSGIKTGPTANCITEKLDLTITPSSDNVTTISACDSYTWNGTTYTTSGNFSVVTGCHTENLALTINSTPAPTGAFTQVYTGTATLADLNVSGTNIKWYDAATKGNLLDNSTAIIDGTTYYASQTLTSCESASLLAVTAKKISEATQNLCTGAISDLVSTPSTTAIWYASSKGLTALAPTDPLATTTYYVAQTMPETTTTLPVAGLFGPNAIAVQADGRILVTDYDGIKRMNADGSNIVTLGSGFIYPIGVAVQADGTILVADAGISSIYQMNSDGSNLITLGSGFSFPAGVAVQADGTILVADSDNSAIKKMNADGSNIVTLGSGFSYPTGVAVQADGSILVADSGNSAIKKMNADGSNIVTLSSGFSDPIRVAVQADGTILVADRGNSSIYQMNSDGSNLITLDSGFSNLIGVAVLADSSILVADNGNSTINKITLASITNRVPVNVTVGTPAPTGTATQTFCGSETVSLLNATGTGIIWYDAATLGAVVPDATVLVNGTTYYASQTISGCESTTRLAVTASVGACLGLSNFDATNLQWYPNPTTGILNISYSKTIEEVSVINLLGQTLFTNKPKTNEVQLDLSKLPTASYFVKVVSDGKSKIIKVIKQ